MSKKLESRLAGAKSVEEFFASAVHELRTPLSAIHGYSELLATGVVPDNEVRSFSGIIHRNSGYVLRLVNSLLDLAKLQSGRFELEKKPFDLFSLCQEIEEVCTPRAEEKNILFEMKLNFPLPRKVFGDAFRLKQVLLNLTGNAVKFTNEGRVEVAVSFDSSSHTLTFKIIDSGIGLSAEQRETLFSAFVQAELSTAREFGGTGLGLVISREIVDQMGGTLEVDSTLGEGSMFGVVLPVGRDGAGELLSEPLRMRSRTQSARRVPVLSGNVLVVEDAADTRELVRYLLERTGLQVMTAESGETGLAAALENQFDLILLDRHLSDMDGTAVACSLRNAGYDRPIIAFSADQLRSRRKWIKDAGLSGAIPKPFSQAELYRGVKKFLKPTSELSEIAESAQTSKHQQSKEVRAVAEQFIESLPSKLELIRGAVDGNDLDAAAAEAHKLCCASLFGFPLLEEAARSLEQAATKGQQPRAVSHLAELEDVIERIISRIS